MYRLISYLLYFIFITPVFALNYQELTTEALEAQEILLSKQAQDGR